MDAVLYGKAWSFTDLQGLELEVRIAELSYEPCIQAGKHKFSKLMYRSVKNVCVADSCMAR